MRAHAAGGAHVARDGAPSGTPAGTRSPLPWHRTLPACWPARTLPARGDGECASAEQARTLRPSAWPGPADCTQRRPRRASARRGFGRRIDRHAERLRPPRGRSRRPLFGPRPHVRRAPLWRAARRSRNAHGTRAVRGHARNAPFQREQFGKLAAREQPGMCRGHTVRCVRRPRRHGVAARGWRPGPRA
eukprot:scaffold183_cov535-Pavlova_lutheri.AAC.2